MISSDQLEHGKVEALLSEAFGFSVVIHRSDRLLPWSVIRIHLTAPRLPESLIVKWLRTDPSAFRTDPEQMRTERTALEFLADLGLNLAPRLITSDRATEILVLEDLAPRVPLADVLRRPDAALAITGLRAFARALGELNAATVGHAEAYYARRRALGPVDPQAERERFLGCGWTGTRSSVEAFGVTMSGPAEVEMATVIETLADPGAFLAFSNGDAQPNNFLVDGGAGRIIDFEFAGYRHALTNAASFHVPGPMWITAGDPIASGVEAEYRKALSHTIAEATDDRLFGAGMAAVCMASAVERLHRLPRLDSRAPRDLSRLQMVSTLEAAAHAANIHRSLPHLTSWTRAVAEMLRRRWPDANLDLTSYRDYTPRS